MAHVHSVHKHLPQKSLTGKTNKLRVTPLSHYIDKINLQYNI